MNPGEKLRKIRVNMAERLVYENQAKELGYKIVAGIDEAGRGPLAGPVVAACVILPEDLTLLEDLDDSKKLKPEKRRHLYLLLHEKSSDIGVGVVDAATIDRINILQATFLAMQKAVAGLRQKPDHLLIDGNQKPAWALAAQMIVAGDAKSLSIAAASIIAKETRDRIMRDYDSMYPQWGFAQHKGYGTAEHLQAIQTHGICEIHRRSFEPVTQLSLLENPR